MFVVRRKMRVTGVDPRSGPGNGRNRKYNALSRECQYNFEDRKKLLKQNSVTELRHSTISWENIFKMIN